MSLESAEQHMSDRKEEKEPFRSISDVERSLLRLYAGLVSPTTSSLTPEEKQLAERSDSSYLFGEVLPAGVSKMLDDDHLDASTARVMYDLGMGCGKLCMQAFLQYPNLVEVVGVELSTSRASVGMEALERLYEQQHDSNGVRWQLDVNTHPPYATLTATSRKLQIKQSKRGAEQRVLSFQEANLFDVQDAARADIIILETNILPPRWLDLTTLLATFKVGSRILTYCRLEDIYASFQRRHPDGTPCADNITCPWRKLPTPYGDDHFAASWGNARFSIYRKVL